MKIKLFWALVMATTAVSAAWADAADDLPKFDASKFSQEVTGCDQLAGDARDPNRVIRGLRKVDMDLPVAIAACKAAVARDPKNPRLNFLLARALDFDGSGSEAGPYRAAALAAGYPQAVLAYSFLYQYGHSGVVTDKCLAGTLGLRSARDGLEPGYFVWHALAGEYDSCPGVTVDSEEMLRLIGATAPDPQSGDSYELALYDFLRSKLQARMKGKKRT